jgi:uncharacterized protein (TIGR02118 family)
MIKVAELLVRKNGMTRAEFQDYWRRVHGPLVMSIPEIRRHVAKYVQSHTLPNWHPFLAGEGPLYDGIAEVWCDSIEDVRRMFAEPKFQELVSPDEVKFLEVPKTVILAMTEQTIYQRTAASIHGGIKLFEMPARRREMSRLECHRYWRDIHAPMVLGSAEMIKRLRRYVQAHSLDDGAAGLQPMRYDGLAELWFDNVGDLQACFGHQYLEVIQPDEPKFVDPDRSSALIAKEYIIYERN